MIRLIQNNKSDQMGLAPLEKGRRKTTGAKRFLTGFTLVELLVAVALFGVAIVFALGSIISVLNANSKAQAMTAVMNNLNFAMESMTREIRFGDTYYCGANDNMGSTLVPNNCDDGEVSVTFNFQGDRIVYRLNNARVERGINGGSYVPITAPEININNLRFYVRGAGDTSENTLQPEVTMIIDGQVSPTTETATDFTLQTTVSQRFLDI